MKYRLTPLNFCCALLVGLEIVFFAFPETLKNETYGYHHIYLIPVILVGLLVDYILQKIVKKYRWLLIIEIGLIAITILLNTEF
jgi:hypothetical protein